MTAFPVEAERAPKPPDHEVIIHLKDGRQLKATRSHPRGTIHDPLDAVDRKAKYIDCVTGKLDNTAAEKLQSLLATFETIEELDAIMKFLRFDAS